MPTDHSFILKLSCPDRHGIVHAVSGFLFERSNNILDSAQFGDSRTSEFFMRVHFEQDGGGADAATALDTLRREFAPLAEQFAMRWELHDAAVKPRVVIMVSKIGHCLNDLLFRYRTGQLPIEIPAIVSNHKEFYQLAASYNIPFHHFPLIGGSSDAAKAAQEARVLEVIDEHQADLVVLARYMQILSPNMCKQLAGRAINIHHSFLPSFKGAKPYYQAFDRGVKLIGATAHYVTTDLDEGPIIEQEVERVDHSMTPDQLTAIGRDVECVTLARAVKWHVEHRIVLNGTKTVVFR
ncbi:MULTISPECIES: formyltetrahydrofolate deformylase [Burkholderia]|uniref:Formyltetrahydrofolate deformylase n=1 Tax=Burkholderia lata (strain ATCC 17760 / DSM 23089 / LMG 22485 / NCIMB 9086 / R18194 / 383) TaxID=482957 RepID=A0A6P2R0U7_BURL3|nr:MULTISPECIES: formyltetrahydrofolate deformylase [Burkholderia]MBN3771536.1 formyltetrahydrofolate deformylase [Burkholderia sp. Se-20378]MBN3797934.1 formyltetrahydrofolate deformylase [Burkholderia sp. Ac-20392]VWC15296.1 formyltetrahydrofolate deformylase [Burkholderia lata]VWC28222.1 formyltetrahydrofolate deformylase [Burkholderia lata]VWM08329.1 formyltetrahydrofolate deformylase [Burkholderia lata]